MAIWTSLYQWSACKGLIRGLQQYTMVYHDNIYKEHIKDILILNWIGQKQNWIRFCLFIRNWTVWYMHIADSNRWYIHAFHHIIYQRYNLHMYAVKIKARHTGFHSCWHEMLSSIRTNFEVTCNTDLCSFNILYLIH